MKYLGIILVLLLGACAKPDSFFKKDCAFHHWDDGQVRCSKYNLVKAENKKPYLQSVYYRGYYYHPQVRFY